MFFLHRYRGKGLFSCSHELLVRVHVPAYSNADQGAENAAWAFGESAALHLRTWWERYELARQCSREHEHSLVGEASEDAVEWADDDHEPLFGPGLRALEVWVPSNARYLSLASAEGVIPGSAHHSVYLLTDEDGQGDLSARQPTSHERHAHRPWDASYVDGPAPWAIGRPQPAVVRLADEGASAGAVLDAGCGTGENALHVAALGLRVVGIDVAETALAIARHIAMSRGLEADFLAADALRLDRLGRVFETVLDCGLFHTFDGDERRDYVASLASVISPVGHLYVLCFSDEGPGPCGPHPVSQDDVRAAFGDGWRVVSVLPERIETRFAAEGVPAWLANIERL